MENLFPRWIQPDTPIIGAKSPHSAHLCLTVQGISGYRGKPAAAEYPSPLSDPAL